MVHTTMKYLRMPDTQPQTPSTQSWWKTFLDFLWDGGYRSTIVFSVTLGAIGITVFSDEICRPMPASVVQPERIAPTPKSDSTQEAKRSNPTDKSKTNPQSNTGQTSTPVPQPQQQQQLVAAGTQLQQQLVVAQPNPICGKYFELAFMVVGGYLGLSVPKINRTPDSDIINPGGGGSSGGSAVVPIRNGSEAVNPGVVTDAPSVITTQTPSPDQPGPTSPAPGAVHPLQSPPAAVGGGGDARSQADNPDNPQPGLQQASQQLPGFSRGGGAA